MTTILIIEDNESTRENINDILQLEGFETLTANHGQQGIELAKRHIPDLIICDVMMPKLNGYEVLKELDSQEDLAGIPFIFLTAKSTRNDFRQGMSLGSNDYLTKPFSPAELVTAIRTQLVKKESIVRSYVRQIDQLSHSINELSQVDPLTQLPNQTVLAHLLEQPSIQTKDLALFLISIDQFNFLSSTLSPSESDELIKQITQRIKDIFPYRMTDKSLKNTFRMGQNQFAVLADQFDLPGKPVDQVIQRFLSLLKAPYLLGHQTVNITGSIGIALTKEVPALSNSISPVEHLLRDAKIAMYRVQQNGGNSYSSYDSKMTLNVFERLELTNALHYALQQGEFEIHYQPQLDLARGCVVGVEALLRWKSSQFGWVSPDRFIPIAEEIGVINSISNWVLYTACLQAKEWQKEFSRPIKVSVNLSPVQLSQGDLSETVRSILSKTGIESNLLCLEVTEKALIKNGEQALEILRDLKNAGVQISIDDFGTGYSGLEYLSTFPCNAIKIDRMFIQNIHQRYTNQRIVAAVTSMSHDLNLKVVAEGAETEEELAFLKTQGCDMVQGYVYAKPMSADAATAFIKSSLYSQSFA